MPIPTAPAFSLTPPPINDAADAHLHARLEEQRGKALRMLLDNAPIRAILNSIVHGIESICDGSLCSILQVTADGQRLSCCAAPSFDPAYNAAVEGLPVGIGNGSCGTAVASGQRVIVEDIRNHPYWAPYRYTAQRAGLQSCWSQPILAPDQQVIGTFAIYHRLPRSPDANDLRVIEHASALAALAIDRHRAQEELARHRDHLEQMVKERSATIVALNTELQARVEEACAANRAKSTFLANMSHEIRTPLNAVVGLAALLQESVTDPAQRQRTERIMAAGQHLLGTIDAILDLSKIDTGKFTLQDDPLRIEAIVGNVVSMMGDRADAKGLTLRTELGAMPENLTGDAVRLQQALLNYVGNAVKFTQLGTVTICGTVLDQTATSALVRFDVSDTGIGLPPGVLDRLFHSFEQADSSIARNYGGSGLGLEITRRFAELMGGEAGASSAEGAGSTFWFTARLNKGAVQTATPVAPDPTTARARLRQHWQGTRVLLAEDEPINAEITTALLETVGLQVDLAVTGREAVEKATTGDYALVLMDMQMPELDGLDATREIRRHCRNPHLPIIAMTANAFAEDREHCLAAGMDGFISKPVLPTRLYSEILVWLQASEKS